MHNGAVNAIIDKELRPRQKKDSAKLAKLPCFHSDGRSQVHIWLQWDDTLEVFLGLVFDAVLDLEVSRLGVSSREIPVAGVKQES